MGRKDSNKQTKTKFEDADRMKSPKLAKKSIGCSQDKTFNAFLATIDKTLRTDLPPWTKYPMPLFLSPRTKHPMPLLPRVAEMAWDVLSRVA